MQKQEAGSTNVECAARRVNVAESIRRRKRKSLIALVLMSAFSALVNAQEITNSNPQAAATAAAAPKVVNIWPGVAHRKRPFWNPASAWFC